MRTRSCFAGAQLSVELGGRNTRLYKWSRLPLSLKGERESKAKHVDLEFGLKFKGLNSSITTYPPCSPPHSPPKLNQISAHEPKDTTNLGD